LIEKEGRGVLREKNVKKKKLRSKGD